MPRRRRAGRAAKTAVSAAQVTVRDRPISSSEPPSSSRKRKRYPSMLPTPNPITVAMKKKMAASGLRSSWATPRQ
jgi:hypothetical protein